MDETTAQLIVIVGTLAGWAVWLVGLRIWQRMRAGARNDEPETFRIEEQETPADVVAGSEEVDGVPEGVADRLADSLGALAAAAPGAVERVHVTDRQPGRLAFLARCKVGSRRHTDLAGAFTFEPVGTSRCRVGYELDIGAIAAKLRTGLGIVLFAVGVPVLIGVPLLLWSVVATSPDPVIRWQSLQILQLVHPLWPPLLFRYIHRRIRTTASTTLAALVRSVERG